MDGNSKTACALIGALALGYLIGSRKKDQKKVCGLGESHPSKPLYGDCIYMDYNATTPIFPEVSNAMQPFTLNCFGNPSSVHAYGLPCRDAVANAREEVARLINCPVPSLIFTSCGSESDNRAIDLAIAHYYSGRQRGGSNSGSPSKSIFGGRSKPVPHIISSTIEHPAIIVYLEHLEAIGSISLTLCGVDRSGKVDPVDVKGALKENTALVSIMHSNNEVGTIQPISDISTAINIHNEVNKAQVLLHTDAAQSIGKVSLDVVELGVDMLTVVGHKFGAPKGVAALYVRPGLPRVPLLFGGGQEGGMRAGTENVLLIVGLGEAARIARAESKQLTAHMLELKRHMVEMLRRFFQEENGYDSDFLIFNGPVFSSDVQSQHALEQLPNTISVAFKGVLVAKVMPTILNSVACSAGSACHEQSTSISPVLEAMNVPTEFALGTLRVSIGRHTTVKEAEEGISIICRAVELFVKSKKKVTS
jgi:cysteine desulfurase